VHESQHTSIMQDLSKYACHGWNVMILDVSTHMGQKLYKL